MKLSPLPPILNPDGKVDLTPKQLQALTMRFMGQTIEATARALSTSEMGVSRQVISQWERLPQWKEEWKVRLDGLKDDTRQVCRNASYMAAATIQSIAQGVGEPVLDPKTGEPTFYERPAKNGVRKEKRHPIDPKLRLQAAITLLKIEGLGNEERVVVTNERDMKKMTDAELMAEVEKAMAVRQATLKQVDQE